MITISLTPALVHLICLQFHLTGPPVLFFFRVSRFLFLTTRSVHFTATSSCLMTSAFPLFNAFHFQLCKIPVSISSCWAYHVQKSLHHTSHCGNYSNNQVITPSINLVTALSVIFSKKCENVSQNMCYK